MGRRKIALALVLAGLVWGGWIVLGWQTVPPGAAGTPEITDAGGVAPSDPPPARPPVSHRPPVLPAGSDDPPIPPAPKGSPNVILISIDSLRADHLGCYGYERPTSPHLDDLAREGTLFETAIASSPWTLPSHMAIFTSLYDMVHGVDQNGLRLGINHPLLAEVLKESGYATAAFYSGPYLHPAFGFDRGFDDYINCTSYKKRESDPMSKVLTPPRETQVLAMEDITSPRIHEEVSKWLGKDRDRPFFLFIHYWDVHFDYVPPPPFDKKFDPDYEGDFDFGQLEFNDGINPKMDKRDLQHLVALYDGEILWTDEWIGKLMGLLREKGILDETLLVITSDHGEEFFEHGEKGHQKNLFDESLRVPLIVRLPGKVPRGRRCAALVRTIDIYPTILDLAGIDLPQGILGASLLPEMKGEQGGQASLAFSELTMGEVGRNFRSLRAASWKLIQDVRTGESRFYDLAADPGEIELAPPWDSRIPEGERQMKDLVAALEALKAALPRGAASRLDRLPPEVLGRLRSLGYIK